MSRGQKSTIIIALIFVFIQTIFPPQTKIEYSGKTERVTYVLYGVFNVQTQSVKTYHGSTKIQETGIEYKINYKLLEYQIFMTLLLASVFWVAFKKQLS